MDLTLTTPALLFPAISLLFLAYTNRFLALAALIRGLHGEYKKAPHERLLRQIRGLRKRVHLIRNMQVMGVASFFLCALTMLLLFGRAYFLAKIIFGLGLVSLLISLFISFLEIQISVEALDLHLHDLEQDKEEVPSR